MGMEMVNKREIQKIRMKIIVKIRVRLM